MENIQEELRISLNTPKTDNKSYIRREYIKLKDLA